MERLSRDDLALVGGPNLLASAPSAPPPRGGAGQGVRPAARRRGHLEDDRPRSSRCLSGQGELAARRALLSSQPGRPSTQLCAQEPLPVPAALLHIRKSLSI